MEALNERDEMRKRWDERQSTFARLDWTKDIGDSIAPSLDACFLDRVTSSH